MCDLTCNGQTPSVQILKDILTPKLNALPKHAVYRLTKFELDLLAQASEEQLALGRKMIAEGLLARK